MTVMPEPDPIPMQPDPNHISMQPDPDPFSKGQAPEPLSEGMYVVTMRVSPDARDRAWEKLKSGYALDVQNLRLRVVAVSVDESRSTWVAVIQLDGRQDIDSVIREWGDIGQIEYQTVSNAEAGRLVAGGGWVDLDKGVDEERTRKIR